MSSPTLLTATTPTSLTTPNGQTSSSSCTVSESQNALLSIFDQLIVDSNSIILSRYSMNINSSQWDFLSQQIGILVNIAESPAVGANERSLIYGQIMLLITCQYLPTVSEFIGDQISEQAALQNMSSDISAFIVQSEMGFNALGSSPDCSCPTTCTTDNDCPGCTELEDCINNYNFYSGIMTLIAGTNGSTIAPASGENYNFTFTATLITSSGNVVSTESNVLAFLTDTTIWGDSVPLDPTQSSQISNALLGVATVFNPTTEDISNGNVALNAWSEMNLTNIASATCSWTQPYGSAGEGDTYTDEEGGSNDPITTGNAPLVWTQPATVQAELNTAAQTIQGVATSTQTIENFQVQEINQFYGITNSIQMSQQQQGASMVKQQQT